MQTEQKDVYNFMVKAGQDTPDRPTVPNLDIRKLRIRLIAQELQELARAYGVRLVMDSNNPEHEIHVAESTVYPLKDDPVEVLTEVLDATEDLQVVVIGNGVAAGIDLEEGWDEVHASNMSKFVDGWRDAFGKWRKGPSARKPDLRPLIENQLAAAEARDLEPALCLDGS